MLVGLFLCIKVHRLNVNLATVVFICGWNGKPGQMLVQNLYEWL